MVHEPRSCRTDMRPPSPAIDRRRFLHTGAACVVPLLAGTTFGRAALAWPNGASAQAPETDAILPLSIPAYPTEVWNSHPQPLVARSWLEEDDGTIWIATAGQGLVRWAKGWALPAVISVARAR